MESWPKQHGPHHSTSSRVNGLVRSLWNPELIKPSLQSRVVRESIVPIGTTPIGKSTKRKKKDEPVIPDDEEEYASTMQKKKKKKGQSPTNKDKVRRPPRGTKISDGKKKKKGI